MSNWNREAALLGIPDLPERAFQHVGDRKIKPQGGGGGGGSQQSTTYTSNIPKWAEQPSVDSMARAQALSEQPYQPYTGQRVEGFSGLQQQAQQNAAGMTTAPQTAQASGLAGAASLGALSAGNYDPRTGSFTNAGVAPQYMSPYMSNVVEMQQRDAQRQADIAGTSRDASAVKAGAFGGSRQAIMDSEAARNLAIQKGDINTAGLQAAFDSGQKQYNTENQLYQQSRQFGAGQQMKSFDTALAGARTLGDLGTQQFGQGMDITKLQSALGAEQQALGQKDLDQQYADFQRQQDYPYQQIGFLSDILRGQQGSTRSVYSTPAQPSTLQTVAGLGTAAAGVSRMFRKGGSVRRFAVGGGLTGTLSDQQLQARMNAPTTPSMGRMAAGDELAERTQFRLAAPPPPPMEQGIASAAPDSVGEFASGGIVGYAPGGPIQHSTVGLRPRQVAAVAPAAGPAGGAYAGSKVFNEWGGYRPEYLAEKKATAAAEALQAATRQQNADAAQWASPGDTGGGLAAGGVVGYAGGGTSEAERRKLYEEANAAANDLEPSYFSQETPTSRVLREQARKKANDAYLSIYGPNAAPAGLAAAAPAAQPTPTTDAQRGGGNVPANTQGIAAAAPARAPVAAPAATSEGGLGAARAGAGARTSGPVGPFGTPEQMSAEMKAFGWDPEKAKANHAITNDAVTAAEKGSAEKAFVEYNDEVAARGLAGAKQEERNIAQQGALDKRSGDAKNMALFQAGMAILSGDPSKGAWANIGSGALVGTAAYNKDMKDINDERTQLFDRMDRIDDMRRAEAIAVGKDRVALRKDIRAAEVEGVKRTATFMQKIDLDVTPTIAREMFKEAQSNRRTRETNDAHIKAAGINAAGRSNELKVTAQLAALGRLDEIERSAYNDVVKSYENELKNAALMPDSPASVNLRNRVMKEAALARDAEAAKNAERRKTLESSVEGILGKGPQGAGGKVQFTNSAPAGAKIR